MPSSILGPHHVGARSSGFRLLLRVASAYIKLLTVKTTADRLRVRSQHKPTQHPIPRNLPTTIRAQRSVPKPTEKSTIGQWLSRSQHVLVEDRPATREPQRDQEELRPATPEPELSEEERAQAQAEMRAKQQKALDKRFGTKTKKLAAKKPNALEEASKENLSWREMDAQTRILRWD